LKSLVGTKTRENLLKSFAGESQARNRYDHVCQGSRKRRLQTNCRTCLRETAENEYQHAKRFFNFLVEGLKRMNFPQLLKFEADYPVALGNTVENLRGCCSRRK
jgi:rubrerythrin